jgi:hypothetical protein
VTDDSIVEHIQVIRIMMMFSLDIFRYTETMWVSVDSFIPDLVIVTLR